MNALPLDPAALLAGLAALSLLPLLVVCTTCFLKVSVVLMIVRNAIGVQQVPPSIAVYALALAISALVMMPVGRQVASIAQQRLGPTQAWQFSDLQALAEPLRGFMLRHTPPEQRARFLALAQAQAAAPAATPATAPASAALLRPPPVPTLSDSDFFVLLPAFVTAELSLAFKIGFALYVPFVVIDLLLSNLLLALGMQMVSPMVLSAPLKILLFVLLDGWTLLSESLVRSYAAG